MKKIWAMFKFTLKDQIEYPAEIYYWLILTLIPLFTMAYLWLTVYQQREQVASFSLSTIITYYFVVMLINRLNSHTAFWISDLVRQGTLSVLLLRPYGFFNFVFTRSLLRKLISFSLSLPVIFAVGYLLREYIVFPSSLAYWLFFLLAVFLSICIFALFGFILGFVSFWTLEIGSIVYFYYTLLDFLGGAFIPLEFFPDTFRNILNLLPFRFLFSLPASVYIQRLTLSEALVGLSYGIVWLGVLAFIYRLLWNAGLKRYAAYGA